MAKKYWWFQGESVRQLTALLTNVGPEAILEVHPDGDGLRLFVLRSDEVSVAEGGGGGGVNDSHPCPPQCR